MSRTKKNKMFKSTPDVDSILEEYRKEKGKASFGIGLSQKIMEITTAGGTSLAGTNAICILCDTRDVCTTCDASDFSCSPSEIICVFDDSCDFPETIEPRPIPKL
jgi:hypothetical protein